MHGLVERLPETAPFVRIAIGAATIAVATTMMAVFIATPWLRIALEAVTGLLWLIVGIVLVRFVMLHRERIIATLAHWVELAGSIASRNEPATRAAAQKLERDLNRSKERDATHPDAPRSDSTSSSPQSNRRGNGSQ